MEKLKSIVRSCSGDACPEIFIDEKRNCFVFQGYILSPEMRAQLKLAVDEDAVVIPADLVDKLMQIKSTR